MSAIIMCLSLWLLVRNVQKWLDERDDKLYEPVFIGKPPVVPDDFDERRARLLYEIDHPPDRDEFERRFRETIENSKKKST
jgi:hypothetical protein